MLTDEEIKAGAASFARTLQVVGGRTSFDYAVRAHLPWFAAAMERGLGWNGIIRVLTAAGVTQDDGRVLSRGHISAVYWRQRHAKQPAELIASPAGSLADEQPRLSRSRSRAVVRSTRTVPNESDAPADAAGVVETANDQASYELETKQTSNARGVRDYMRRALASQRFNDEDS